MVLAVYRSGDSGLKNLEKKNHGVGSNDHVSLSKGEYHETMVLNKRPINGIVMLTMIAGEKKQVIKVS
jgi:hypothetical protein